MEQGDGAQGDAHGEGTGDQGDLPTVTRRPRSAPRRRSAPRAALIGGAVVVFVAVAVAVVAARGGSEERATEVKAEVTVAPADTTVSTTVPQPDGPVAPLTGVRHFAGDAGRLERPALVAKIDNHPDALPQRGLDRADVVIELRVEGISRFMAVFHSAEVDSIEPVRSARTSDPDLAAMFGRPLFVWSGGNEATTRVIRDTPWLQDMNPSVIDPAFSRDRSRSAPHNLVVDTRQIFAAAQADSVAPAPLFGYLEPGQDPGGVPVQGFDLSIGSSTAGFVWNQPRGGWLRWTDGAAHDDGAGGQLAPTNVVVLETNYVDSSADARSPEAQSLGAGRAWIFTQGRLIEGNWVRSDRTQPWQLTDASGVPVSLTPGTTWVELPETGSAPRLLAAPATTAPQPPAG